MKTITIPKSPQTFTEVVKTGWNFGTAVYQDILPYAFLIALLSALVSLSLPTSAPGQVEETGIGAGFLIYKNGFLLLFYMAYIYLFTSFYSFLIESGIQIISNYCITS